MKPLHYFLQTPEWANFWKNASGANHNYTFFEDENYSSYIYEYSWKLKQKFWYLPKGPILKNVNKDVGILELDLKQFFEKIIIEAKQKNICFIKFDFDDNLTKSLDYDNISNYVKLLKNLPLKNLLVTSNTKKIQYLQSTVCDLSCCIKHDSITDTLIQFWDNNQVFWSKTNEQVRRYTRKLLKEYESENYSYSFEKTKENFEAFWAVHYSTAQRQNFSTQPKKYLYEMMMENFGRICVVYNEKKEPLSVFLGIMLNDCLYYILGGNTPSAMHNRSQYLLQLLVIRQARLEGCNNYDMGGYEVGSGYSKFKDGYRGKLRQFLGPIDVALKPLTYKNIQTLIKIRKKVKDLSFLKK